MKRVLKLANDLEKQSVKQVLGEDLFNSTEQYLGLEPTLGSDKSQPTSVVLDSIKVAEDDDGIIYRFYESEGKSCQYKFILFDSKDTIEEVDGLENILKNGYAANGLTNEVKLLNFTPFQIRSFRIRV